MTAEPLLLFEHDDARAAVWRTRRFEVAWVATKGPDKELSEDALVCHEFADAAVAVCVVDGMGGMQNGRAAARTSVEAIATELRSHTVGESRRARLVEAFERAHAEVLGSCPGGGATGVAAVVTSDFVQTVHAGDAEALLFGQRGRLKHRTVAQSPVGYALHAGLLSEEDALRHPERHLVSNGIGIENMTIQVGPKIAFARRDTLVLASDGLTDNVFETEIVEALRKGPLDRQLEVLATMARDRMRAAICRGDESELGKPDDLTALAVRMTGR